KKKFRQNLRLSLDRGLSESDALAALTIVPARLCGVENLLGTIEPGKLANLTIVEGESYFDPKAKVRAVWIDGRNIPVAGEEPQGKELEGKPEEKTAAGEAGQPAVSKEEPEKRARPPESVENKAGAPGTTEEQGAKKETKGEQARQLQRTRVA